MDKEFLQKVNIDSLQKEVKMDLESIARLIDLKNPRNIYKWAKDQQEYGTRPSYNAIVKLLEAGASVETLFGVDYKRVKTAPAELTQEQILAGVKKALADLGNAL